MTSLSIPSYQHVLQGQTATVPLKDALVQALLIEHPKSPGRIITGLRGYPMTRAEHQARKTLMQRERRQRNPGGRIQENRDYRARRTERGLPPL
jgi:hypothetical protein